MKKLFLILVFVQLFVCCSRESNKLNEIIKEYESERGYEFNRNESVENTIKYHQAEADFAKKIIKKLEMISDEKLSESEVISRELLLSVLKNKIDFNKYKMYLNTITNENAFHLNLSRMGNQTFKNKEQVLNYLEQLDSLPKRVEYNLNILRASIEEGMSQPRAIFSNYSYSYEKHIVSNPIKSDFYKPFHMLPDSLSNEFKDSIIKIANASIQKNVISQYNYFLRMSIFPMQESN